LAQTKTVFYKLTARGAAPQSITYAVKQDSLGVLWIASDEGVLRYDSKNIQIYNSYQGLPPMVGNRARQIFIDSKQQVWLGMEKAICLYNKKSDSFELIGDQNSINPAYIMSINEDDEHSIWLGASNGLWQVKSNNTLLPFFAKHKVQAVLPYNNSILLGTPSGLFAFHKSTKDISAIHFDKPQNIRSLVKIQHKIFAGANNGQVFQLDTINFQPHIVNLKAKIHKPVFDIVQFKNQIFIATDGEGLYRFDTHYNLIAHYTENPNNLHSISSNGIYDLELGKENILWIATYGGGINYLKLDALPFINIQHQINTPNSIISNFTRAISVDKYGRIWFGTKNGISIWNPKNNKWEHIHLNKSPNTSQIIVLSLEADNDYMWVGTYGQGLFKIKIDNPEKISQGNQLFPGLQLSKIYTLLKDSKGNLWLGGIEGDLSVIRKKALVETYPITDVKTIIEAKDGQIIVGTRDGIYIINDELKQFNKIQGLFSKDFLANAKINTIYQDTTGQLIVGTNGAGLIFYHPDTKIKSVLNVSKGLPSDVIQGVLAINDHDIWISTTRGIAHINTKSKDTIINTYDKNDGLAFTEYNFGSYAKINDSLFAFGGTEGVSLFNPNKIKVQLSKPNLIFDAFKLSNKLVKPGQKPLKLHINETKEINLQHNENTFEISFTGIQHNNPEHIKYSWKLEGFDQAWTPPGYYDFATYTNLNPGTYIFKVRAFDNYGTPGPIRQIKINIKSPWWATGWAYLIYALLVMGIIMAVIHFTSVIINKKHADEQISFFNNITHEIKTPLAVLISTLDNITEKTESDEQTNKRIKTTVNRIKSLFEQMLNFHRVTSDKYFSDEVQKIDLDLLLNRIIHNFRPLIKKRRLNIEVNNKWGDKPFYFNLEIVEKILQNLLSNAIKYSFDDGKIQINTGKTKQGELRIQVIDEGMGIPKDQQKYILNRYYRARNVINSQRPGTGLGLIMVKKLIDKTGGNIKFVSKENKGSKFTVTLKNLFKKYQPVKKEKEVNEQHVRQEIEDQTDTSAFREAKILIVEDNDSLRESLAKTISHYFQVFEAKNGKEGLAVARQIYPDIILTDLIMPEMDGMQMAKIIKEDISLNHIPIFMLSVLTQPEHKMKSAETGITSYFEKPVDIKYLLAKILNTLKSHKKLRDKYIHESDLDIANSYRNKNDREFLKKLEKIILDNLENDNFSVHDLANEMGMSRTSLYMKLKNLVDLSPQDFIIHTKLRLAKKLLIQGTMSIKEVAYSSGFSNPKYFSTVFKKFYKMSPRAFLESLKGDIK